MVQMDMSKVVLAVILLIGCESLADDTPVIETTLGKVRGFTKTSFSGRKFNAYLGIPYAKPPEGSLRFKPPVPGDRWEDVLEAKTMTKCIQQSEPQASEDCLQVGIYTHDVNKSLPVMFFIHGGAFMNGNFPMFGPEYLMDEEIVIVGTHYRVGILGFLSFENSDLPGNFGLKDQVLALKWVKDNIKFFGGNPDDITIMGDSAGAASVYHHLISPMSKGLFHKAVIESGSSYGSWALPPPGVAKLSAERVSTDLHCPKDSKDAVPCLRTLKASDFNNVTFGMQEILCPVFEAPGDDAFLSAPLSKVEHKPVPLIMGMTSAEGLMFSLPYLESNETFNNFTTDFSQRPGYYLQYYKSSSKPKELDKKVLNYYGLEQKLTIKNWRNITQALSDSVFTVAILDGIMNHTGPVYPYYFDYPGKHQVPPWVGDENIWFGAFHVSETSYIWKRPNSQLPEREMTLSKNLVKMVTNFIKYGNPTPNNTGVVWEKWTPDNQNFLYVDPQANISIRKSVHSETYRFWRSLNYRDLYETSGSQNIHNFFLLPVLIFFISIVQYL